MAKRLVLAFLLGAAFCIGLRQGRIGCRHQDHDTARVAVVAIAAGAAIVAGVVWILAGQKSHEISTSGRLETTFIVNRSTAMVASDQPSENDTIGHDQPASGQVIDAGPIRAEVANPQRATSVLKEQAHELAELHAVFAHLNSGKNGEDKH